MNGLSIEQSGYRLSPIHAPAQVGDDGKLSFQLLGPDANPVAEYATSHERNLHLMVVRSDGAEFSHVHPELDSSNGTWSLPWTWRKAGTYRVFIDVLPAGSGEPHALTLSCTVHVAGDFEPETPEESTTAPVDGFEATVYGSLVAGGASDLTISISRDGRPVTALEPYLGAYGHLVALREGDLGYLHIHPEGEAPVRARPRGRRSRSWRTPRRRESTCCTWTSKSTVSSTPPASSSRPLLATGATTSTGITAATEPPETDQATHL